MIDDEDYKPKKKKVNLPISREFVGRPLVYETPEELWTKAIEYFETVTTNSGIIRATISGLTRHCGFSSRSSWVDYAKRSEEFSHTVNMIKMVVVEWYERNLHMHNWAGSAFALRNMDSGNWKDEIIQQNHTHIVSVEPVVRPTGTPFASKESDVNID